MKTVMLVQLIFVLAIGSGWVLNIYKLVTVCDFEAPYKCEGIRAAGLIPPVGMIVGWMDIDA